jgi:hypothetical protein
MRHKNIHFPAVIVATLAHFALGAVWFTALSKQWLTGAGITPAQMEVARSHPTIVPYLISLIGSFGMAVVIARVINLSGVSNAAGGARLALMLGVGIAMLPIMIETFFEMRHLRFALIIGGYPAVGSLIMGAILGSWRGKAASQLVSKAAA